MFEFLAFADQASTVEDDDQRAGSVHRGGQGWLDVTQGRESHADYNKGDTEKKVLVDDGAGATGELHQEGQAAQVIVHQGNGGAVNGYLAASGAHRDADIV